MLKLGLPMLGLLAYRLMVAQKQHFLWIPAIGILALMALVMVTGERSAALLTLFGLGVLALLLFYHQPEARLPIMAMFGGALGMLVLLATTQTVVQERGLYLIEQIDDFWNTPYGQLFIGAWRLWEQNPLTGYWP